MKMTDTKRYDQAFRVACHPSIFTVSGMYSGFMHCASVLNTPYAFFNAESPASVAMDAPKNAVVSNRCGHKNFIPRYP